MQLRDRSTGNRITLETAAPLGRGGEAQVYPVVGMPDQVAKIYVPGKATTERAHKLVIMLANPPEAPRSGDDHVPLAWPQSLLTRTDDANAVVGFLMPRAHAAAQVIDYYNPQRRLELCPLFDYRYLLRTARNLAATTRTVHTRGYVIGDLKHSNVLVSQTALVTLVDTDSFQVRDPQSGRIYPCQVGTPDYTPPERQHDGDPSAPLTPEHDLFALGVLIFQLLMEGTHPFAGVYTGDGDPPPFEERIAAGHFPYGARSGPYRPGRRTAPPFEILPPSLQALFLQCFEAGHADPTARPDAQTWQTALDAACRSLASCADNPHHFYSPHLGYCPWCERRDTQLRGLDPFPAVAPRIEPIPHPTPVAVAPVRVPGPSLALATPSQSLRSGKGLTFGWVGLASAIIFGLSLLNGQLQTNAIHNGDSFHNDEQAQNIGVAPPVDTNSVAIVMSRDNQLLAEYNATTEMLKITRSTSSYPIDLFTFPAGKFAGFEFSADDQSLTIVKKDHTKVHWSLAAHKFQ